MSLPERRFTTTSDKSLPLHCVARSGFDAWRTQQLPALQLPASAAGSTRTPSTRRSGSLLLLPGEHGIAGAVLGIGDPLDPMSYAHAPFALPPGDWHLASELDADARAALQLGWGLGAYRFTRYKQPPRAPARLLLDNVDDAMLDRSPPARACATWSTRRPSTWARTSSNRCAARSPNAMARRSRSISGDDLLAQNFPAIHAVGRASHRAPRLIALRWGDDAHPHVALVGKGVCFDTGGLDIKTADGMRNMKKDMGGAAHAIALAELVMARKLPLRITLLVPAVENAIGPNAFRPGEVIATRQGISVEIDNTDAEGRVVLCDALTYAGEHEARTDPRLRHPHRRGAHRARPGPAGAVQQRRRARQCLARRRRSNSAIRCGACRCGARTCAT